MSRNCACWIRASNSNTSTSYVRAPRTCQMSVPDYFPPIFLTSGDIGGQMGLFIGASILSVLELFDYAYEVSLSHQAVRGKGQSYAYGIENGLKAHDDAARLFKLHRVYPVTSGLLGPYVRCSELFV